MAGGFSFGSAVGLKAIARAEDPRVAPSSRSACRSRPSRAGSCRARAVPALYVAGERDAFGPPEELERFVGDSGTVVIVPGAGHFFEGGLESVGGVIEGFLATLTVEPRRRAARTAFRERRPRFRPGARADLLRSGARNPRGALSRRAAAAARRRTARRPSASRAGLFVTLRKGGELRGCIGTLAPTGDLTRCVSEYALRAALEDPRFAPLAHDELAALHDRDLGAHALRGRSRVPRTSRSAATGSSSRSDGRRGLLLPQVAEEWGFDAERFLAEVARKAGLPPDAWRRAGRPPVGLRRRGVLRMKGTGNRQKKIVAPRGPRGGFKPPRDPRPPQGRGIQQQRGGNGGVQRIHRRPHRDRELAVEVAVGAGRQAAALASDRRARRGSRTAANASSPPAETAPQIGTAGRLRVGGERLERDPSGDRDAQHAAGAARARRGDGRSRRCRARRATPAPPAASATRTIAPRLPGSWMPKTKTTGPGRAEDLGHRDVAPARDRQQVLRRARVGEPLEDGARHQPRMRRRSARRAGRA